MDIFYPIPSYREPASIFPANAPNALGYASSFVPQPWKRTLLSLIVRARLDRMFVPTFGIVAQRDGSATSYRLGAARRALEAAIQKLRVDHWAVQQSAIVKIRTRGDAQGSAAFVRRVKRATRRKYTPEEKVRIVLERFRSEIGISALCRREGIHPTVCYSWLKDFMEAGKARLQADTA